jgi:hypothetical protein
MTAGVDVRRQGGTMLALFIKREGANEARQLVARANDEGRSIDVTQEIGSREAWSPSTSLEE